MHGPKAILFLLIISICGRAFVQSSESIDEAPPSTADELVRRVKRYLVFNNGGLVKNVLGILVPVDFGDNSKRSLNLGYNFQSQYNVPPLPTSIFQAPFFTGFTKRSATPPAPTAPDESRRYVYAALEQTWIRRGRNGTACILRAICEVAACPFAHGSGMLGEVVDAIFTPPHSEHDDDWEGAPFKEARQAGLNHADCQATYWGCPPGHGYFDSISHFLEP